MTARPRELVRNMFFCEQAAKKNLESKKKKAKAGIEPVSVGIIEPVEIVTRWRLSILV